MTEYYMTGGDSYFPLELHKAAAQTFRVVQPLTLTEVSLQLKLWSAGIEPCLSIHYADAEHKPFGDKLAISNYWKLPDFFGGQTKTIPFNMTSYNLNPAEYYALVVRAYPPFLTWPPEWQYNAGDATYPRGIRLSYNSDPELWTQHYQDDHLFIITGTPILPPPPTPPPPSNWSLRDLKIKPTQTQVKIIAYTDRTCHLWLRWTTKPPWRHSKQTYRRGIYLRDDLRFCFVVYQEQEQEEEGDTLTHTFYLSDWQFCTTRWFYFHGTILGIASPSTSPIFFYHRHIEFPVLLFTEPWTYPSQPPSNLQLLLFEPWTHPSPPPPPFIKRVYEPWTFYTAYDQLIFAEPWTYPSPPPPTLIQLFTEPWTYPSPPPPTLIQLFTEPWTYPSPPPPDQQNLFTEVWND